MQRVAGLGLAVLKAQSGQGFDAPEWSSSDRTQLRNGPLIIGQSSDRKRASKPGAQLQLLCPRIGLRLQPSKSKHQTILQKGFMPADGYSSFRYRNRISWQGLPSSSSKDRAFARWRQCVVLALAGRTQASKLEAVC